MPSQWKHRCLFLFTLLIFFAGLALKFDLTWFVMGAIVYLVFQNLGVGIGLHRYLSHRTFKTNSFWHKTLISVGTLSGVGSPITWAGLHVYHHQTSDTEKDPHSPHYHSLWGNSDRLLLV